VGANFSGFNGVCAFSGRRSSRRQRGACGDFINLKDLSAQSSKMLLGVGLRACIHRDECVCVVSAFNVLCNWQKKKKRMRMQDEFNDQNESLDQFLSILCAFCEY
jgi:hypothetical protein